jgi:dihydropteroate synthase
MSKENKVLRCGDRELIKDERTFIMGILNVTPDSFSDGGNFNDSAYAIAHGQRLIEEGADIIDVGGVSTAPNAQPVNLQEELRRVIPVIRGLVKRGITNISIDTTSAFVARQALDCGASWINDQSAGVRDKKMAEVMIHAEAIVLMHDGNGETSGVDAGEGVHYESVMSSLKTFFLSRINELQERKVDPQKIVVDPGVGFGKGLKDSLTLINNMHCLSDVGAMSLIGVSRKSFIGKITGIAIPKERDCASLGAHAAAILSGVNIVRTHNVKATRDMARVFDLCVSGHKKEKLL